MSKYAGQDWCKTCNQLVDYHDEGDGAPQCCFCGGTFMNAKHARQIMQSEQRGYHCPLCSGGWSRHKRGIIEHLKAQHNEKEYEAWLEDLRNAARQSMGD
jgi:hypothetical protein